MHRPPLNDCMISCFKNALLFRVLDIRIPTSDDFLREFKTNLYRMPLIIASMIGVKDQSENYKPEYVIPQMLMEYIISNNNEVVASGNGQNVIFGIYYTSTHRNTDFEYPVEKLNNLALPVQEPLKLEGLCSKLIETFSVTGAAYAEYQYLLHGTASWWQELELDASKKEMSYGASEFYFLEESFSDEWAFQCLRPEEKINDAVQ